VIKALISDFGGVLTSPLLAALENFNHHLDLTAEDFGRAMAKGMAEYGEHPLFALERGEITEREFNDRLERALRELLGRDVDLSRMAELMMAHLHPNHELFDYYRSLRDEHGLRLGILTNNVREWEPLWRSKLPIDEIFEDVVDSAFVGMRKPEPEIYALALSRLGVQAAECAFVDDTLVNVDAARTLGFGAVHFRDTAQAIAEIDALLSS
jgi:epoxide hydrolase-like predicted phosphatase